MRAPLLFVFLPFLLPSSSSAQPACPAQIVEYSVVGSLKLSDTPMGEGDGTYRIGPGRAVLRFEGNDVKMLAYNMEEHFTVHAKTLFWSTTVVTDANAVATPNACSVAAEGTLQGHELRWRTPVTGYHIDGKLTCDGSFCGRFGAPPPGKSPLHIGPYDATFKSFEFAPDMKTFTMATTPAVKTEQPKQTSEVAVAGREIARRCVAPPPPCQ